MAIRRTLLELAINYHKGLPQRIRQYLNARGIPDVLIDFHLLGWNGWRITIPIYNREGELAFFKLAKDPEDKLPGPKIMASPGSYLELYGWEHVKAKPQEIIICEGEFDRLVLETNGFRSVTSTGGASAFRREWAADFEQIPEVFICFDHDEAGRNGALRVGRLIPHAKIIELPAEVGESGDVTDYFVRLGKTREDFIEIIKEAKPASPAPEIPAYVPSAPGFDNPLRERIERLKKTCPIADIVGRYVKLNLSGSYFTGHCPFHDDQNPSLAVYPGTATYRCYGCGKRGDVITFLREMEHVGFAQALDMLENLAAKQNGETPQ